MKLQMAGRTIRLYVFTLLQIPSVRTITSTLLLRLQVRFYVTATKVGVLNESDVRPSVYPSVLSQNGIIRAKWLLQNTNRKSNPHWSAWLYAIDKAFLRPNNFQFHCNLLLLFDFLYFTGFISVWFVTVAARFA